MGKFIDGLKKGGSWTYRFCESCMKNSHVRNEMVREKLADDVQSEMWICKICGATKGL